MLVRRHAYSACLGDWAVAHRGGGNTGGFLGQEPAFHTCLLAWAADDDALLLAPGERDEYADFAAS